MENRMDRIGQPSGDNQPPSSEGELPLSPALLQEQPTTSPEQQRFKRIMRLTLLLGILVGIWLVLMGVMQYDLGFTPRGGFHLAAPIVDELLLPLLFILTGAILVLRWRMQILRTQLSAFWHSTESVKASSRILIWVSAGFFFLVLGCFMLIGRAVDLPSDVASPIMEVGFFMWLIGTCSADLYLTFRGKLRAAQR